MPPFDGPRATLCVTRYPSKTCVVPSSIATGMETATAFLHCCRTLTRFGSIANVCATWRNCDLAMSYGFSRRCETGASTVVTLSSFLRANGGILGRAARSLLDPEDHRPRRRGTTSGPPRDQSQLKVAVGKDRARRVSPGHAERVSAREHVTQAREQTDASTVGAPELEIETRERDNIGPSTCAKNGTCDQAQQRRRRIRRSERACRQANRCEHRLLSGTEDDRPRHTHLTAGERRRDKRTFCGCSTLELARRPRTDVYAHESPRPQRHAFRPHREVESCRALSVDVHIERENQAPRGEIAQQELLRRPPARAERASQRKRRGSGRNLRGRCAAEIDEARPLRGDVVVRKRTRGTDEQALEPIGVEVRPRLCQERGGPGDERCCNARTVHRPVARSFIGVTAWLRRLERNSRRDKLRLDPAVEGEAGRREARDAPLSAVRCRSQRSERNRRRDAATELLEESLRHVRRNRNGRDRS